MISRAKKDYIFNSIWNKDELEVFNKLTTPIRIQQFLDSIPYSDESKYRCPRTVLKDRKAHCFDGALFAAAALRRIGYPPIIIDIEAYRDDDHIIAIYKKNGCLGAVAKSNFVGLRFREAIYRNYRELILSYFEPYFNLEKIKGMRSYSLPVNLTSFDKFNWMIDDKGMDEIEKRLNNTKFTKLLTPSMIKSLSPVDDRTYEAGMLGINMAGVYDPRKEK